jgi:hypothetical protein
LGLLLRAFLRTGGGSPSRKKIKSRSILHLWSRRESRFSILRGRLTLGGQDLTLQNEINKAAAAERTRLVLDLGGKLLLGSFEF